MTEKTSTQALDWNGDNGARWVANQAWLDQMLAPYGQTALDAAAPRSGEQVLDIGCGAGTTSFQIARHLRPDGRVLGVDISEPLIARAVEIAQGQDLPVAFRLSDAGAADFAPAAFDLLFSRFGVMFFDDPVTAFANLRRALKPDGRIVFVCWRSAAENDWTRLPMSALRDIVPGLAPADPTAPGPFSFGDKTRVEAILSAAGFGDIDFKPVEHPILFGSGETRDAALDEALDHALQVGPLGRAVVGQPADVATRAIAAVRAAFSEKWNPEGVVIDGAAWIVTARASAA